MGPVQVGSVVRFEDGRTGLVIRYRPTDTGWRSRAVNIEDPSQVIEFGSQSGPALQGVIDTLPALAQVDKL